MSPIITVPNPVLRQPTKSIEIIDKKTLDIISQMRQALLAAKNPQGVGLAAPQIGIPLKMFFIRPEPKKDPLLFINPEIITYSQRLQQPDSKHGVYEGCLSVPHHYSPLKRSMSVTVKYQTPQLITKTEVFTGFAAHIIQHETDHLNGILFIDRVLEQNSQLYHIQGKTWEEISL